MMKTVTLQTEGQGQKELQRQKCPVCGELGIIRPVELLPKSGIAMECIHDNNNSSHMWAEYDSFESVVAKNVRKTIDPERMVCPVCGKKGRINSWRPDAIRPWIIHYQIVHGSIAGTWGKKGHHSKQLRHNILTQEHRDIVLKRLGRYIPTKQEQEQEKELQIEAPTKQPKPKTKKTTHHKPKLDVHARINCPRCHTRGRLNLYYHPDPVYVVAHESIVGSWGKSKRKKMRRCYMRVGPEMEIAEKKYKRLT